MLKNFDQIAARISTGFNKQSQAAFNFPAARTTPITLSTTGNIALGRALNFPALPGSLESGVTAYLPTEFVLGNSSSSPILLCELINLGSIDLSTGVFTDGSAMPTRKVFNTSKQLASPILTEVEKATSGTPGNITITYKDQDANAAESLAAITIQTGASPSAAVIQKLNSGDWGATDITNVVQAGSSSPGGVLRFRGMIPICTVLAAAATGVQVDLLNSGIVRRLAAGAQIGAFSYTSLAANGYLGRINYVGDN